MSEDAIDKIEKIFIQDVYPIGIWIVGIISFCAIWIYAFSLLGLFFGLMFAWIPALIGGMLLGVLWPLVILAVIGLIILINT